MKSTRFISILFTIFVTITSANAQKNMWGQIIEGIANGASQGIEVATLKKIINNPSLQSQDMKNYLTHYRNGDVYMSNGDYKNAAESYSAAWLIATKTTDTYLKRLWTGYGWAQDTNAKAEKACSLAGINIYSSEAAVINGFGTGTTSTYSSGGTSSTNKSRVCSLCHGTGLKIHESYVGSSQRKYCSICGKTVMGGHSHITCDLCKGTGTLNY